ncbi:transcription and mRNA export factor ENY2 [Trichonephila clavipes]|nr:transcription and mRNA export factor ENY2 [Trichonephila clavipes]
MNAETDFSIKYTVAAVAEWSRYWIVAGLVTSSSLVPLITRRVKELETRRLNKQQHNMSENMIESNDIEKFKELLRTRLSESGWKEEMKAVCRDIIREKGIENVSVESLVKEMTPKGRALVPDSVKRELLQRIRSHLDPMST